LVFKCSKIRFWEIINNFDNTQKLLLINTILNVSVIPEGGFKEIKPKFRICKSNNLSISIFKEFNRIDLPEFKSKEIFYDSLLKILKK
jgi:hypothetical protein